MREWRGRQDPGLAEAILQQKGPEEAAAAVAERPQIAV